MQLLIESATRYVKAQHIDDADPYSPNSFDIFARIGRGDEKIILFLRETIVNNWGIPRWEAIDALCALRDSEADRILREILHGMHRPKKLDIDSDIRRIKSARGLDFVNSHGNPR